jgi:hypothetical protein
MKDSDGRVRTVSVDWDGETPAILTRMLEGTTTTTEREVWSISADGTQLTRSRRTTSWNGTSTEQSRFQKSKAQKPGEACATVAKEDDAASTLPLQNAN